jgi:hypothetical protein
MAGEANGVSEGVGSPDDVGSADGYDEGEELVHAVVRIAAEKTAAMNRMTSDRILLLS